jgi:hypothetical protein
MQYKNLNDYAEFLNEMLEIKGENLYIFLKVIYESRERYFFSIIDVHTDKCFERFNLIKLLRVTFEEGKKKCNN